jgi:hypothetical protein
MDWITGIDMRHHGAGAIHFSAWLARASRAAEGERFVPVHVLEDEHLRFVLRLHHLDEVVRAARAAARAALEQADAPTAFADPEVVTGGLAADGLAAALRARGAAGIVVGRVARSEAHGLVRLGQVARALVRDLPAPIVVVPPDVGVAGIGDGPVVALTALRESSPACRFGEDLARRTGRPLAIVHVVAPPDDVSYLVRGTLEQIARERRAEAERDLEAWVRAHHLAPATARVLEGDVVGAALAFARAQRAPLLVAGASGPRPAGAGALLARDLAANAPMAVALVPDR